MFFLRIIKLASRLQGQREFLLSKQLVRSGTSIGANIAKAGFAASHKDFLNKNRIALKEAAETKYWLMLLKASDFYLESLDDEIDEVEEIIRLLAAIVKTLSNKN